MKDYGFSLGALSWITPSGETSSQATQWRGPQGEELKPFAESCVNELGLEAPAPFEAPDDSRLWSQPEPSHPDKLLRQS